MESTPIDALIAIQNLLNDPSVRVDEQVQSLWSGYGSILRLISGDTGQRFIVKVIAPQQKTSHPRGWNTSASHARKLHSYQVECCFYQRYAHLTESDCLVPQYVASTPFQAGTLLVMQDLDALGFTQRKDTADLNTLKRLIRWLAFFHVKFMHCDGDGLWPTGTYWHLATRQDEWQKMPASDFKSKANVLDETLSSAQFQTLVHGDAKIANFCFDEERQRLAAVDFQYVGRGSGVKDLAYLVGSALHDDELYAYHEWVLDEYLAQLQCACEQLAVKLPLVQLEQEVRRLYPVAWADFYRFLLGWNPQSWKIAGYMQEIAAEGLANCS